MKISELRDTPYLDRFKPNSDYTQVLYRPDRPVQSAELTESQSILHHYISRLGSTIFLDGNIQDGMTFHVSENKTSITVESGLVYLDGKVRSFEQQTIPFEPNGTFKLGVAIERKVVTHKEDENLLAQTSNTTSYLSPGADRLFERVVLKGNDNNSATIYHFEDGELFIQPSNPEMTKIHDMLAERTYDESGSYRVSGLDLYTEPHESDETLLNLIIDTGRAYIMGYQVDKPSSSRVPINKALDTRTVNAEAFYYSNRTRRSKLGNSPVANVQRVVAQTKINRQLVTRGAVGSGTDSLPHSSVFNVTRVWQEQSGEVVQEYTRGRDWQLINGREIDWSPSGSEPNTGSTYFVDYTYNKTMQNGIDYRVVTEGEEGFTETYIDFNGMVGSKPIPDSMVTVDYTYYLARQDLVVMDRYGEIHVNGGQSDSLALVEPPYYDDPYTLALGSVIIHPNSNMTSTIKSNVTRLSMEDLQKVKTRVDNLEFNQAINALDQPAMQGQNPITLRGVFSDGFISTDKADTTHPDMNIAFSFEDAEITLPYASVTAHKPSYLNGSSLAHNWGRLVTAPFDEVVGIEQANATETHNINPYNVFNKRAMLRLTPSEDNFVEEENVTVFRDDFTQERPIRMRRWWAYPPGHHAMDEAIASMISVDDAWDMRGRGFDEEFGQNIGNWRWDQAFGRTGRILKDGGQQTIENSVQFMRQINVSFHGKNYLPNASNLRLLFDGIQVPITPASGYSSGSVSGTINADANGEVKGSFRIPAGVRTGTRQVFLQNDSNAGTANFISQGIHRRVEDIIIRKHVTVDLFDPLAQSFQFPTNQVVTSFDVFFASKDRTHNVSFQVRNITEGGMPGKTIYAQATLTPSQVNVTSDASVPTKVTFDDPLVADAGKEYALVILCDTDTYTVHVATRGQNDINTGETITSNPYNQGVLYSSANASAWTIHQNSDLKFRVNVASFNEKAVIEFDTLTDISADSILLMATYLTPENTGCVWDMKVVMKNEPESVTIDSKPWRPIANFMDIEVGQVARLVKLRATFKANDNMSPLLSLHDITFTTFLTALRASYISRTIDQSEAPYNRIRLRYQTFEPSNTQVIPRYSVDGGETWQNFTTTAQTSTVDDQFVQFSFDEEVASGGQTHDSLKIRLDLSSQNSFIRPRARRLMVSTRDE